MPAKVLYYSGCVYVYICVYHKERGGSKGECLRLRWRACTHVFLLLMSVCVCHGWVSVQTKAPQRTKAHVINLSGRQDLKGYSRQGKPWSTDGADPAGTSRLESDWRTVKLFLPLPAALIVLAPMSLLNLWVLHWLLLKVSRQMHHLSASTYSWQRAGATGKWHQEVGSHDLSFTVWRWVTWLVDGYLWNDSKKKLKKGIFPPPIILLTRAKVIKILHTVFTHSLCPNFYLHNKHVESFYPESRL